MKLKILKSLTKRTESLLSLISLNSLSSLFRSRQPYNFAFCILHFGFIYLTLQKLNKTYYDAGFFEW